MTEAHALPERSQIVQQHLDAAGIASRVRELPESTRTAADAASALDCEVGAIASSLVFIADDQPILVMTSGRHRVDITVLARQLGAQSVAMAPAKVVRNVTGQAIGGVSPVGHPAQLRTLVDDALRDYATIWAAGGTPHTVFPLTFNDLLAITNGISISVADN